MVRGREQPSGAVVRMGFMRLTVLMQPRGHSRDGLPITSHRSRFTSHREKAIFSRTYAIHVHLDGGDAFSAGDFFAGVSGEFQEAENRQRGDSGLAARRLHPQ
jgi:hypothetical protein